MLFKNEMFRSFYDFDQEVPDELSNLDALSEELFQLTQKLNEYPAPVYIHADYPWILERSSIQAWNRSRLEIKEILYRNEINGKSQKQFSINKALKEWGVYESDEEKEYKVYLQLLYFFYVVRYFIFPKQNIFHIFKKKDFEYSMDIGSHEQKYVNFLLNQLLENEELRYRFLFQNKILNELVYSISKSLKDSTWTLKQKQECLPLILEDCLEEISFSKNKNMDLVFGKIYNYSISAYINFLLENIERCDAFRVQDFDVLPTSIWKNMYINLEDIESFLYTDEIYMFCRQTKKKPEKRDLIKFNQGNSVLFLKKLITYDQDWIESHGEGLFIQEGTIYALIIACILKTYYELMNRKRLRILNNKKEQTLRSIFDSRDVVTTLGVRFFLLACHAQYEKVVHDMEYEDFKQDYLIPEILFLKWMKEVYQQDSLANSIRLSDALSLRL